MIRINLLGDVAARSNTTNLQIAIFGISSFFLLTGLYVVSDNISTKHETLVREKQALEYQLENVKRKTTVVRDLEEKKKILRNKLSVIAELKRSKSGPVRVLDDLNISLPKRAWLTSVVEKERYVSIEGMALDNQTISEFLNQLEDSDYFESVDLGESRSSNYQSVEMKRFTLSSKISYIGTLGTAENVENEGADADTEAEAETGTEAETDVEA